LRSGGFGKTALLADWAQGGGRPVAWLGLDDYHLIDSGPVHASVALLLENPPQGLHLVVSSRADPPLPLARLRARGRLAELRVADSQAMLEQVSHLLGKLGTANRTEAVTRASSA
jgi:LuxR family maltose regulon positive regulatory protein